MAKLGNNQVPILFTKDFWLFFQSSVSVSGRWHHVRASTWVQPYWVHTWGCSCVLLALLCLRVSEYELTLTNQVPLIHTCLLSFVSSPSRPRAKLLLDSSPFNVSWYSSQGKMSPATFVSLSRGLTSATSTSLEAVTHLPAACDWPLNEANFSKRQPCYSTTFCYLYIVSQQYSFFPVLAGPVVTYHRPSMRYLSYLPLPIHFRLNLIIIVPFLP